MVSDAQICYLLFVLWIYVDFRILVVTSNNTSAWAVESHGRHDFTDKIINRLIDDGIPVCTFNLKTVSQSILQKSDFTSPSS